MSKRAWRYHASITALSLAMSASIAHAQSSVEQVEVRAANLSLAAPTNGASRMGLTPLETPAAIEILTGDTIRARGDIALSDAIARSTGIVQQNNPGNGSTASFAARGFNGVGSVKILLDGMSLFVGAGTVTFPFDTFTVDRVEVLKGPASVLYGQGAIGGAVNVVPKRPSFDMQTYDVQAGLGSDRTYRVGVGAGGPVSEVLAYRADISRVSSNGYVDRGDSSSWALSGALTWKPAENLSLTLSDDYGDQKPMRYFGVPLIDGKVDSRSRSLNYNVSDAIMHFKDNATQLRAEWIGDNLKVRNSLFRLTSKRQWQNAESYFYTPSTRTVERTDYIPIKHDERQIGDVFDVNLRQTLGSLDNNLLVGAEANKIRFVHTNDGFPGTTVTLPAFGFQPGLYVETGVFRPRYRTQSATGALFIEDQLKVTSQLSLVAGVRRDSYHVRRYDLVSGNRVVNKHLDATSWRVGAVYQPVETVSLYAQYATGVDALGSLITTSASQVPYDLSTGRQAEVGAKGLFAGGRGEWTVAGYKIVKKKLLTRVSTSPALTQQVGERSAAGIEASVSFQLAAGWSIDANGAVLNAKYDDFTDFVSGVGISRNGKTPPNVPEKSANIWLNWQATPVVRLFGGVRYVGKQYGDNANSASLILPSYTVGDAGLEWRVRDNMAVTAQVYNVTDETYGTNAYNDEQWILGRPRSFEVRLTGRF